MFWIRSRQLHLHPLGELLEGLVRGQGKLLQKAEVGRFIPGAVDVLHDPVELPGGEDFGVVAAVLVADREKMQKKYPKAMVVPATIDEIMLLYVKGEK